METPFVNTVPKYNMIKLVNQLLCILIHFLLLEKNFKFIIRRNLIRYSKEIFDCIRSGVDRIDSNGILIINDKYEVNRNAI